MFHYNNKLKPWYSKLRFRNYSVSTWRQTLCVFFCPSLQSRQKVIISADWGFENKGNVGIKFQRNFLSQSKCLLEITLLLIYISKYWFKRNNMDNQLIKTKQTMFCHINNKGTLQNHSRIFSGKIFEMAVRSKGSKRLSNPCTLKHVNRHFYKSRP